MAAKTNWVDEDTPDHVAADWTYTAEAANIVAAEAIRKTSDPSMLKIAMYSWDHMATLDDQMRWWGFKYVKTGGIPDDTQATCCANFGMDWMWFTYGLNFVVEDGVPRGANHPTDDSTCLLPQNYGTRAAWIADWKALVGYFLDIYGPLGTFWASNPQLPYHPIRSMVLDAEWNFNYPDDGQTDFNLKMTNRASYYAELMPAVYDYMKMNYPEVLVVSSAISMESAAGSYATQSLCTQLASAGRMDPAPWDVFGMDAYNASDTYDAVGPEQTTTNSWGSYVMTSELVLTKGYLKAAGYDGPLWIAETGWKLKQEAGGYYGTTTGSCTSETQHAAFVLRMHMAAARYGFERVYNMCIVDTDGYNGGWWDTDQFTLDPNAPPREVATVMRHVARLLEGAVAMEIVLDGEGASRATAPWAYRFITPKGRVMVAWNQGGSTTSLPIDSDITTVVAQMDGTVIDTIVPGSSTYSATLAEAPILLYPQGGSQGEKGDTGSPAAPRVLTITSNATPSINTDNYDAVTITALAAAVTSFTSNLSGTPANFQRLMIRIKDDGTARSLTWGTKFSSSGVASLPTTTILGKVHHVGLQYDTVLAKWVCLSADATGY